MEKFGQYSVCVRKAILSTIAFWGYFLVRTLLYGFVAVFFENEETRLFGYPEEFVVIATVLGCILALFIFYDYHLCDYIKEKEYVESLDEDYTFSLKNEIKTAFKSPEFLVGQGVIVFWCICVKSVYFIPTVLFSLIAEFWARKNWFNARNFFGKKKKKKGIYAFRLMLHIGVWAFNFIGGIFIVALLKSGFTPIVTALKNYVVIIFWAIIIMAVLSFVLHRLRAIKVQYKTIRRLKNLAKENRMKLKLPKHPYISVLLQRIEPFSLEHRNITVNGIIVPTILRKTPLYFLGDGLIQRTRTYYFFKIELFSKHKFMHYSFPESKRGEKKIILLSPIPREFFLANANYGEEYKTEMIANPFTFKNGKVPKTYFSSVSSEHADGDNGSSVDGALIYSGSAFCNYIRRICNN